MLYKLLIFAIPLLIGSTSNVTPLSNAPLEEFASIQTGQIVLGNTSVGGLKIGMSENEVIRKLGAPKNRQVSANQCTGNNDIDLKYNNLDLYLEKGSSKKARSYLIAIITTNSRYATNKRIRVGDLISKAEKAYSKAAETSEERRYLSLFDPKHAGCGLTFSSTNNKTVNEIRLACDMTC